MKLNDKRSGLPLPLPTACSASRSNSRAPAASPKKLLHAILALFLPAYALYHISRPTQQSSTLVRWLGPPARASSVDWSWLDWRKQCPGLHPIQLGEFASRRNELARLLKEGQDGWGAYVTEPSPNTLYYVNLTQSDCPSSSPSNGHHLSILTPTFELSRSQRLPFAVDPEQLDKSVSWVTWDEADDPYAVLVQHLAKLRSQNAKADVKGRAWRLHLEENTRQFVSNGLERSAAALQGERIEVWLASTEVRQQRMRKTQAELQIQRCVAKITLNALRAVRTRLRIGMTEKDGESLITDALRAGGLTDIGVITLFGENAALPHATASKTKRLKEGEFALFDVDGSLHGYMSDFTRTMLPDIHPRARFIKGSNSDSAPIREWPSARAKTIWETIHRAQEAALASLKTNKTVYAADVDRAARNVIASKGWAQFFTHRLGHGIGLQVHEAPYLNGGNVDEQLESGETFSNEPGVYIERNADPDGLGIGVRLEDMVHKTADGWELLSGMPLAQSPWEP